MSKSFEEIASVIFSRRQARGPLIEQMMKVRERYNGDWVIPDFNLPPVTPALVADAVDHLALRAASVQPNIFCPAVDQTKETGKRSKEWAGYRKKALHYSWWKSEWHLHSRRAYRHLAGYATTALVVTWNFDMGCPNLIVRDPLHAFPEPKAAEDLSPIRDCGFVYGKSAEWIRANYPKAQTIVPPSPRSSTVLWDLCEWIDEDDVVVGVLGPREDQTQGWEWGQAKGKAMELRRWENRAGMCTAIIPERVTLDRIASQVANMVGTVDLLAFLTALDIEASERSVFPDRYAVGTPGGVPILVDGVWKDGRTGEVNLLTDTAQIGEVRGTPDPNNKITQDRLERGFRISTGLVPQAGGETYGALRTGRGIDALMSAAVDPRVQELQELMATRLGLANEAIFAMYEGYAPNKKYEVFSGWSTDPGLVEFTPATHFETRANLVQYPLPGADVQSMTIALGQLFGAGMISKQTAMRLHPFISDPDSNMRERNVEDAEEAARLMILNRSQDPQGGLTPIDVANLAAELEKGSSWSQAIIKVDEMARERQAREAPPAPEGMVAPPEAMTGLANAGEGAESPLPPAVGEPEPSLDNVRAIVRALGSAPAA